MMAPFFGSRCAKLSLAILVLIGSKAFADDGVTREQCFAWLKESIVNFESRPQLGSNAKLDQTILKVIGGQPRLNPESVKPNDVDLTWDVPTGQNFPLSVSASAEVSAGRLQHSLENKIENGRAQEFHFQLTSDEKLIGPKSTLEVEQVRDVDKNCQQKIVTTTVSEILVDGNSLALIRQTFGTYGEAPGEVRRRIVPLPKNRLFIMSFRNYVERKRLVAYINSLAGKDLVLPGSPDYPFFEAKIGHVQNGKIFDPILQKTVDSFAAHYQVDLLKVNYEYDMNASKESPFKVEAVHGSETWHLPFAQWDKGQVPAPSDAVPAKAMAYYEPTQEPTKVIFTTNHALVFPNIAAYWRVKLLGEDAGYFTYEAAPLPEINYKTMRLPKGASVAPDPNFLQETNMVKFNFPELQALAAKVRKQLSPKSNSLEKVAAIARVVNESFYYDSTRLTVAKPVQELSTPELLKLDGGTCGNFSNVFVAIARALGVPARSIYGIMFSSDSMQRHGWIEFEDEAGIWHPYEPQDFTLKLDPANYLPLLVLPKDTYKSDLSDEEILTANVAIEAKVVATKPAK